MMTELTGPLERLLNEMRRALRKLPWPDFCAAKPEGERRDYARAIAPGAELARRRDDIVGGEG